MWTESKSPHEFRLAGCEFHHHDTSVFMHHRQEQPLNERTRIIAVSMVCPDNHSWEQHFLKEGCRIRNMETEGQEQSSTAPICIGQRRQDHTPCWCSSASSCKRIATSANKYIQAQSKSQTPQTLTTRRCKTWLAAPSEISFNNIHCVRPKWPHTKSDSAYDQDHHSVVRIYKIHEMIIKQEQPSRKTQTYEMIVL